MNSDAPMAFPSDSNSDAPTSTSPGSYSDVTMEVSTGSDSDTTTASSRRCTGSSSDETMPDVSHLPHSEGSNE